MSEARSREAQVKALEAAISALSEAIMSFSFSDCPLVLLNSIRELRALKTQLENQPINARQ